MKKITKELIEMAVEENINAINDCDLTELEMFNTNDINEVANMIYSTFIEYTRDYYGKYDVNFDGKDNVIKEIKKYYQELKIAYGIQ